MEGGVDKRSEAESKWPALIALGAVMGLQWVAKGTVAGDQLTVLKWAILPVEVLLLLVLFVKADHRRHSVLERRAILVLSGMVAFTNVIAAALLVWHIIDGKHDDVTNSAATLLGTGAAIFATNTIVFAIWYWQLDRGGPFYRWRGLTDRALPGRWHFLFTQDADNDVRKMVDAEEWRPRFFDYMYLSITNVAAFSPTDTMPLTRSAKALMTVQSVISLSTLAVVLARAVNVVNVKP